MEISKWEPAHKPGDELKEQVHTLDIHRQIIDLINNDACLLRCHFKGSDITEVGTPHFKNLCKATVSSYSVSLSRSTTERLETMP